jgi:hypothetical protein
MRKWGISHINKTFKNRSLGPILEPILFKGGKCHAQTALYLEKFVVGFGLTQLYIKLNFYGPQETIRTHQSSIVDSVRPGLITHIQFFKAQSIEEKPVAAHQLTNFFQRGLVESLKR